MSHTLEAPAANTPAASPVPIDQCREIAWTIADCLSAVTQRDVDVLEWPEEDDTTSIGICDSLVANYEPGPGHWQVRKGCTPEVLAYGATAGEALLSAFKLTADHYAAAMVALRAIEQRPASA